MYEGTFLVTSRVTKAGKLALDTLHDLISTAEAAVRRQQGTEFNGAAPRVVLFLTVSSLNAAAALKDLAALGHGFSCWGPARFLIEAAINITYIALDPKLAKDFAEHAAVPLA